MGSMIKNIAIGLSLLLSSISLFLLIAEGVTRFIDTHISDQKIAVADDGGSRLKDYTLEKKPGVFRVLALGDSITYGQGVHKNDTFAKRVEFLLNRDSINSRFEVINTGFCGINTSQELMILLDKGPDALNRPELISEGYIGMAYKPDLILLQYTVSNDAMDSLEPLPHRWKDGVRRYNHGNYALPMPENIDRWLTSHSKFYLFFLNKYHGFLSWLGLRDELNRIKAMYKSSAEGWRTTKNAMERIGLIAASNNIPAVIILWSTGDAGDLKEIFTLVGRTGKEKGFHVLDLSAVHWPNENFAVSMTDGHPNAKAHSIAATVIYNFLKSEKLVPVE